ncbi:MAG: response regulator [Deltaproteobacteria bacterium]|nr:response regulator [Deltaproteobacteria bacterium]
MASRILIVDDDADFVAMTKLALEAAGYEVGAAVSGDDAMTVLDGGFKADGMILDVMMAGRADGMIAARKLRKHPTYKSIPILMLTGMRQATGFAPIKDDPRDPVFLPVDVFLEKPVTREKLVAAVQDLLAAKR